MTTGSTNDVDRTGKPTPSGDAVEAKSTPPAELTGPESRLRPALRKAIDASWERNEEAYRYLGR